MQETVLEVGALHPEAPTSRTVSCILTSSAMCPSGSSRVRLRSGTARPQSRSKPPPDVSPEKQTGGVAQAAPLLVAFKRRTLHRPARKLAAGRSRARRKAATLNLAVFLGAQALRSTRLDLERGIKLHGARLRCQRNDVSDIGTPKDSGHSDPQRNSGRLHRIRRERGPNGPICLLVLRATPGLPSSFGQTQIRFTQEPFYRFNTWFRRSR